METNSNQLTNEVAKTIEKTFTNTTKEIMDFYTKQLNGATSFYKNLFDPFTNLSKAWDNNSSLSKGFLVSDITKVFSSPFAGMSNNFSNSFTPMYDQLYKQMVDYNTSMFSNLPAGLKANMDLTEMTKKYQEVLNAGIESYNDILKTATESFNKQSDVSLEANKKVMEEMNSQLQMIVKQNRQSWSNLIASTQTSSNSLEKSVKDSIITEIKKRTAVPATELSDHKG